MQKPALLVLALWLLIAPAFSQTNSAPAAPKPLSLPDVVAYLSGGIQTPTVAALVRRGLDFALTDGVTAGLKGCGADEEELQAMRLNQAAARKEWLPAYGKICAAVRSSDDETAMQLMNALPEKPGAAAAMYFFARMVNDTGNPEAAMELAQKAVSLEPSIAENHTLLVLMLLDQNANEQALAEAKLTLEKNPNLGEAHRVYGVALQANGDKTGAISELKEAVRLAPYSNKAKLTLSNALENSNDLE